MPALFPSLISSNILNLSHEIKRLEPYVDGFHIDVMDFHFVPNLTWGPCFVNAIRKATSKQLWVHLMVDQPERYIPLMQLQHNDIVSVHIENINNQTLISLLKTIKQDGQQPSVALSPTTSISTIKPLLNNNDIAQILLMSVQPGFSGQTLLPDTMQRLEQLVALQKETNPSFLIGMDGGITPENIHLLKGVNQIAVASGIFEQTDQIEAIKKLRNA